MRISDSRYVCVVVFPVFALALALCSGCSVRQPARVPHTTTSVDQPDVPVPSEFRREYGYSYDEFGFRSWKAKYVGTKKRRTIEDWYRPRMLDEGWVLQSTHVGAKTSLVYFKNNSEQAVLTIAEEFFPEEDRYNTVVYANVGPIDVYAKRVEEVVPGATVATEGEPESAATPVPVSDTGETGGLLPRTDRQ